jgi:hypothetical protein
MALRAPAESGPAPSSGIKNSLIWYQECKQRLAMENYVKMENSNDSLK